MSPAPVLDRAFAAASEYLAAAGVECLLIGGFAVNHYGYSRSTLDVDFMIAADRLDEVRRVMIELGFSNVTVEDNVAFFSVPGSSLRVDFLRVEESTLRELLGRSAEALVHGHRLRVPALRDLISMNVPVPTVSLPPPRLTMDEYADCIQYLLDATDPARARAQKEFEECFEVPFSLRMADGSRRVGGPAVRKDPGRLET